MSWLQGRLVYDGSGAWRMSIDDIDGVDSIDIDIEKSPVETGWDVSIDVALETGERWSHATMVNDSFIVSAESYAEGYTSAIWATLEALGKGKPQ